MDIGKLKHRITVQEYQEGEQDPMTGDIISGWVTKAITWAQIEGINGREFIRANAEQASTTWRITLRYFKGLKPGQRILHDDDIFNIKAVLPNNNKTMITVMAETGVNNG